MNIEKYEKFFTENSYNFLFHYCNCWPISIERLRKYKDILYWYSIVSNSKMNIDEYLVDEFKDLILHSEYSSIYDKDYFMWTEERLLKYKSYLQWEPLLKNDFLFLSPKICKIFNKEIQKVFDDDQYQYFSEEFKKMILNFTPSNYADYILNNLLKEFSHGFELFLTKESEVELFSNINWYQLSKNTYLPWTDEFIEKHADKFDWYQLVINKSFPWNETLVEKYIDKIEFNSLAFNERLFFSIDFFNRHQDKILLNDVSIEIVVNSSDSGGKTVIVNGCEYYQYDVFFDNFDCTRLVKWDLQTLKRFEDKINWRGLCFNIKMDWTIDIVNEFYDNLDMDMIGHNFKFWNDIFSNLNDDDLDYFLDKILESNPLE
jgi:hypothetical protein